MKTFIRSIIFGLFGAVAVSVSFAAGMATWVLFIAWASYYLFGKNIRLALPAFGQMLLGIGMGMVMQLLGGISTSYLGGFGFPLTVFLCIGSLAYITRLKPISNIPAWFLGLIVFFGVHPALEPLALGQIFLTLLTGLLFALANDYAVSKAATH